MKRIGPRNFQYEIKLKGKLYKEVENAEITLTTVAEDSPKDFKFTVNRLIRIMLSWLLALTISCKPIASSDRLVGTVEMFRSKLS